MALYRQGSGCKKHGSNSNSNSSTNNSKRRLRGFFFSNLSIFQCAVLVFAFIILTVFFLLFSSSLPRGDYQILRRNDNYDHEHFSDLHNRKPNENGDMLDDTDWEELNKGGRGNSKLNDKGNVVRKKSKVLHFGQNSYGSGRDSRDWDRDDRRRDDEYGIDDPAFLDKVSSIDQEVSVLESGDGYKKSSVFSEHGKIERERDRVSENAAGKKSIVVNESGAFKRKAVDQKRQYDELYNEKGRDELKLYEEQYKSSLEHKISEIGVHKEEQSDLEDEYDDGIDEDYVQSADEEGTVTQNSVLGILEKQTGDNSSFEKEPLVTTSSDSKIINNTEKNEERPFFGNDILKKSPLLLRGFHQDKPKGSHEKLEASRTPHLGKRKSNLMRKGKRRKHAGTICELKFLNSTSELVEPKANPKFANFSLQYVEKESFPEFSKSDFRFAGHQTLKEREASFLAHDQLLHCGFIKGSDGSNTGFELSQNDAKFLSTCQIAVSSCIFGNSDNLRTPPGKKVTRSSKKHVCFVMFVDEMTLKMMVSEGRQPDDKGYIGLWKVVVVRNLPYADMRRTGKVPKFLTHRLFPSARYSIWLDSKLRLQSDPLLILENFLWRKGFEYAISNHYDRHCVWEEVAQNKKLNKFNHTVIDEQFRFYQSDGLTKFNASDPNKLLPSYVPEGSFIVRAHTPMSNLFSCLWFNEVDRFTPRDQLSFAYTYLKLQRMNPEKHFYLNMFKDCERRQMAKLFHHRIDPLDGGMQPDH